MYVKKRYESRRANEARMLKGNNYAYHRDFAGKSGSIGDLRLYSDGKITFSSYNSAKYPSAAWKFKDLDTASQFYDALDYKLTNLSYGRCGDEELAGYLSRKYPDLRVEAADAKEDLTLTYMLYTIIYKDLYETDGREIDTFYNLNQSEAPHAVEETKGKFGAPSTALEGKATEYLRDAIKNKHAVKVKWVALSNWGNDYYESWSYDLVNGLRCPDHIKKKLPSV